MMREREAFGKKRSNKIGSRIGNDNSASNKQSKTDAGSKGGSIVVIIDGSVAFQGESKPAAWAFVAAAGRGEIYRLCKIPWEIPSEVN